MPRAHYTMRYGKGKTLKGYAAMEGDDGLQEAIKKAIERKFQRELGTKIVVEWHAEPVIDATFRHSAEATIFYSGLTPSDYSNVKAYSAHVTYELPE